MKLNFTKKFVTGIYPYSLMFSSFTPADASRTLKTTMTGQEWCGEVFSQLNEERVNSRARRYLRDLRRDAVIEFR